jgi:hypothetical protein
MEDRVEQIKERVRVSVNKAIKLLEKTYELDNIDINNPAFITVMELNNVLFQLDWLDDEGLKTKTNGKKSKHRFRL